MDAKQINQTFDLTFYVGAIVKLAKKVNYHVGPCPMCGGRDRFTLKHTAGGDVWHCRNCAPDGYHTPIDFFIAYHGIDFKEAFKQMGGEVQRPQPQRVRLANPAPVQVAPDSDWQAGTWREVNAACDRLLGDWTGKGFEASEAGEPGRRYLTERGISRGMMNWCLLGYGEAYGRTAIYIPYLDLGKVITAVKYRYIDPLAQTAK